MGGRETNVRLQAARPACVCSTWARELWLFLWLKLIGPDTSSVTDLATSISLYSNPSGIRTVTRCSLPVAGTVMHPTGAELGIVGAAHGDVVVP